MLSTQHSIALRCATDHQKLPYLFIRTHPRHLISVDAIIPFPSIFTTCVRWRFKAIIIFSNRCRCWNRHHRFWSKSLLWSFNITSKIPRRIMAIGSSRSFHHFPITNVRLDGANGSKNKHVCDQVKSGIKSLSRTAALGEGRHAAQPIPQSSKMDKGQIGARINMYAIKSSRGSSHHLEQLLWKKCKARSSGNPPEKQNRQGQTKNKRTTNP